MLASASAITTAAALRYRHNGGDYSRLAHFTRCQCGIRNGIIDAADSVVWRNNAIAPGTSTAIPESAAAAIAPMAAVLVPHLIGRTAKRSEYSTSHVVHP